MAIGIETAALNLSVALLCGGLIGTERQWRQRLAGLRTNTLVALGAASFVIFSMVFEDEVSPTRVAAQVVSGIGFLGAGIIFREGLSVRGLNTAATLWCSAAVGVLAGAGAWIFAALVTAMVIFVNLALRPLVQRLNRQPSAGAEQAEDYTVEIVCRTQAEAHVRALMFAGFAEGGLHLRALDSADIAGSDQVRVLAEVLAAGRARPAVEAVGAG
jgi:putative Mg2+ transporter-C (MgtC) family protein